MDTTTENTDVPESFVERWQSIVDTMAEIVDVPAALIMKLDQPHIEVLLANKAGGNPYTAGDRSLLAGMYCEKVIATKEKLLVEDATTDDEWKDKPGAEKGLISYLGFPLLWPDGRPFGTLCVLDLKPNPHGALYERLMQQFTELIESHLLLVDVNRELENKNRELSNRLCEITELRRIFPMCAGCRRVRDDKGYWQAVEAYLLDHTDIMFTFGLCPTCAESLE